MTRRQGCLGMALRQLLRLHTQSVVHQRVHHNSIIVGRDGLIPHELVDHSCNTTQTRRQDQINSTHSDCARMS